MCCRRRQQQYSLQAEPPLQRSQCAARRQHRRESNGLIADSLSALRTDLCPRPVIRVSHWTEYQPRTMAGILVMGIALGLQEGGKKIKEKRDERKAKKAALAAIAYTPTESSSPGTIREAQSSHRRSGRDKSQEARQDQERCSLSSERISQEDAPPSYEEVPRPTYEEAVRLDRYGH